METVWPTLGLTYDLKVQQKTILGSLSSGHHVFGLLPTGFGKSDCFGLFGRVMDKLHPGKSHLTLVISPLRSLMMDQAERWKKMGVASAAIMRDMSAETTQSVLSGQVKLVFASPEIILQRPWWEWIRDNRQDICLLALDEVHCLTKWGESFRPEYGKISSLRSLLSCPLLMLTATATEAMFETILEKLHLSRGEVDVVSVVPNRPNIHLDIKRATNDLGTELGWVLAHLKTEGKKAEKIIIYSRTITTVTRVWGWLMKQLGPNAYSEQPPSVQNRLVDMFHGNTDANSQSRILSLFTQADSSLRCVVATMAFGMGVQVTNIRHVVHWGPSTDILSYWQEVGRCGRDNEQGHAKMYVYPKSLDVRFIDANMIGLVKSIETTCIRKTVLEHLFVQGMDRNDITAACQLDSGCCNVCDS